MPNDVTEGDHPVTDLGDTGRALAVELEDAYAEKAAAEARIAAARAQIERLLDDAGATDATAHGRPIATWRPVVSQRFDSMLAKRLLEMLGVSPEQIAASCYTTVETRSFRRVAL